MDLMLAYIVPRTVTQMIMSIAVLGSAKERTEINNQIVIVGSYRVSC